MHRTTIAVLAAAALALSACASAGAEPVDLSAADVVIVADDMTFVDPPDTLSAGALTLAIDNQGRAPHDVTFEGGPGEVVHANGGRQDVATVDLEPGTYTVYCSISGHRQAGMAFEVTVR